jgi:uncharacterized protein
VRPEGSAGRLCKEGIPLFIIHSTTDEVVPFGHAERIKKACPKAVFWKLEEYEHVGAYAHPEYRERLLRFLWTSEAKRSRGYARGIKITTTDRRNAQIVGY